MGSKGTEHLATHGQSQLARTRAAPRPCQPRALNSAAIVVVDRRAQEHARN
jgi:hypothetical protein